MRYVAFLRGINVGGRTIQMSELKSCFHGLGLKDVVTVLQTGNVIFTSSQIPQALKNKIELELTKSFSYPARVQIFSIEDLRKIVDAYPFAGNGEDQHDYIVFFENGLNKQILAENANIDEAIESVMDGDGVIYWRVPKGMTLNSSFAKCLTKTKYRSFNTNRNLKTLNKIVQTING